MNLLLMFWSKVKRQYTDFFYMNMIDHDALNYLYRKSFLSIIVGIIKIKHGHEEDLIKK